MVGFRASGGSLYFNTVLDPSTAFTVFVSAARRPEGLKSGFDFSAISSASREADCDRDLSLLGLPDPAARGDAERLCD